MRLSLPAALAPRRKYGNKVVEADGYRFDSHAEYLDYLVLKSRAQAGEITDLRVHPSFVLLEGFRDQRGKWWRAIFYEADFSYIEGEQAIVIDTKGCLTPQFRLKEKLFRHTYDGIYDLRVVRV